MAGTVPVPESAAECGLPAALSLMVSVAVRAPAAAGLKVTFSVALLPAATVIGKALGLKLKSLALLPEIEMFETTRLAPPVFVTVTDMVVGVSTG